MAEILYAWVVNLTDGNTQVFLARADSPSEAVERITLKVASQVKNPESFLRIDQRLRSEDPIGVDFSEGVGSLLLLRQK